MSIQHFTWHDGLGLRTSGKHTLALSEVFQFASNDVNRQYHPKMRKPLQFRGVGNSFLSPARRHSRWHWFSCYAFWRLYGQLGWNCEYELTKYHRYCLRLEVYIHMFEIIDNICMYFHICMWCIHINMIYITRIVAMLQNSDMPKPLNSSVIPVLSSWCWYWELPGTNLQKDIPSFPPLKQLADFWHRIHSGSTSHCGYHDFATFFVCVLLLLESCQLGTFTNDGNLSSIKNPGRCVLLLKMGRFSRHKKPPPQSRFYYVALRGRKEPLANQAAWHPPNNMMLRKTYPTNAYQAILYVSDFTLAIEHVVFMFSSN